MRLSVYKSMGPENMHPRVLKKKKPADVTAKLFSIILEKLWLPAEVPGD